MSTPYLAEETVLALDLQAESSRKHHPSPCPCLRMADYGGRAGARTKSGSEWTALAGRNWYTRPSPHAGCRSEAVHHVSHDSYLTLGFSPASDVTFCPVCDHVIRGRQTGWDYLISDDGRAESKTSKVAFDCWAGRLPPFIG